jgi:hypothetical protein
VGVAVGMTAVRVTAVRVRARMRVTVVRCVFAHSIAMDGSAKLVKRSHRLRDGDGPATLTVVRPLLLLLAGSPLLVIGIASGCSSSPSGDGGGDADADAGPTCPNVLPAACPSPAPSYETDVLPIFEQRCYMCHADGGITTSGSGIDLGSYAQVYMLRGDVTSEVNACKMPPATATQPTLEQRTALLGWLKCNAPDD